MFHHILVATDGSQCAERAIMHGLSLAKSLGAKVTAATVTDMIPTGPYTPIPFPSDIARYEATAAASAEKILDRVRESARAIGLICETEHIVDRPPAEGILAACEQRGCDLIVMGSHGRHGLVQLILGSQASRVVTQSRVPVLICR